MGDTVTVVAYGDGLVDAITARELVGVEAGIELIDLVSLNPIDYETILHQLQKLAGLFASTPPTRHLALGQKLSQKWHKTQTYN